MGDSGFWRCRGLDLQMSGRPLLMAILNVTPDSFSDGGRYAGDQAVLRARALLDAGADIIDVGGESTRPGAREVSEEEELSRVMPVIEALSALDGAVISVDTRKARVAAAALETGAHIVNDVSAGADPEMFGVVAGSGAGMVLMHMRGTPETMQADPEYRDVVREVAGYLEERVAAARAAGLSRESLVVDPGIGFGKTTAHNLALLGDRDVLSSLGSPVLVGLSRKRFLGELTGCDVDNRMVPSIAGMLVAVQNGARIVRVHDLVESRAALDIWWAAREGK